MHFEIDFLESHDEASLIAELQRIARERGTNRITAKEINKYGRVNSRTIALKFGTLRYAMVAAGLKPTYFTKPTDEELFQIVAGLWTITLREHGRRPRAKEVEKYGLPISSRTIMTRFGSWKKALAATARAMNPSGGDPRSGQSALIIPKRKALTIARRFDVLKRDGYKCRICRNAGGELEVDHIVPVSKGGTNKLENLQTVCRACNRSKGTRLM